MALVISLNGKRLHPFFVQKLKLSLRLLHARASEDFSYFLQSCRFRLILIPQLLSQSFFILSPPLQFSSSSIFWISTSTDSGFSVSNSF